jgi:hypothetical protein
MKDTLRYKHMVARLKGLPSYKKEAALLEEIADGQQWRIDAALEAVSPPDWRTFDIENILKNTAIHARQQTIEKIVDTLGLIHGEQPVQTAFDIAARNGNYKTARSLYDRGATAAKAPEATSKAMAEGDVRKLNFLLKTGADAETLHKQAVALGAQKAAAHLETKLSEPAAQPAAVPVVPVQFKTDLELDGEKVFIDAWKVPAVAPQLKSALKEAEISSQGIEFTLKNGRTFGWSEQAENREFIGTRNQQQGFDNFDAAAIVAASRTRGWTSIRVYGTDEQKEALYLEAQKQDMKVVGYEPKNPPPATAPKPTTTGPAL